MQNAYVRHPTVPSDTSPTLSHHSQWPTLPHNSHSSHHLTSSSTTTPTPLDDLSSLQTDKMDSGANSPGLKLKIKLGAQAMSDGSASPRSIKEEDETNPLKIIIKKTDLSSGAGGGALVNLLSFPELVNRPKYYKEALSSSVEQLDTWKEPALNALNGELDGLKKQFKELSATLQNQMDSLDSWKNKGINRLTNLSGGKRKERDISDYFQKANTKNAQSKKKKKSESSSDEDPTYEKKDTSSDEEIDVVDVEDAPSNTETESNGKKRSKSQDFKKSSSGVQTKVSSQMKKRNTSQTNRANRQQKLNRPARAHARERNRNRQSFSGGYSSEEEALARRYKTNFWGDVDPYFAPFTPDDEKFIAPTNIDPTDPAFVIPPLGKHYKEEWGEDDEEEAMLSSRSTRTVSARSINQPVIENGVTKMIPAYGDLTQRILAALIEERIIPLEVAKGHHDLLTNGFAKEPKLLRNVQRNATPSSCVPLEMPPTYDFSYSSAMALEDRIKLELKSIGLLDNVELELDGQEDDEICSELRKLQKQLKDQITSTNAIKAKLVALLPAVMRQEETERKDRQTFVHLEKTYQKLQQQKKKKRKSTRHEVT